MTAETHETAPSSPSAAGRGSDQITCLQDIIDRPQVATLDDLKTHTPNHSEQIATYMPIVQQKIDALAPKLTGFILPGLGDNFKAPPGRSGEKRKLYIALCILASYARIEQEKNSLQRIPGFDEQIAGLTTADKAQMMQKLMGSLLQDGAQAITAKVNEIKDRLTKLSPRYLLLKVQAARFATLLAKYKEQGKIEAAMKHAVLGVTLANTTSGIQRIASLKRRFQLNKRKNLGTYTDGAVRFIGQFKQFPALINTFYHDIVVPFYKNLLMETPSAITHAWASIPTQTPK